MTGPTVREWFFKGSLAPFEFDFSLSSPHRDPEGGIFRELSALLHQHGLENILGVRSLDRYDPELSVEITEGNTNIMTPKGSVRESELIEAFWILATHLYH